jgi:hypothetical protein
MNLKEAIDYIAADYDSFIRRTMKESIKGKNETEEYHRELIEQLHPIIIILSIGTGSLSGFSHLQDFFSGLRIITESKDSGSISYRKLLLIPKMVRLKLALPPTPVFSENNTIKNLDVRKFIQYPNIEPQDEYIHTTYEPRNYILAIDPQFANPTMVGHPEVSPIQYTANQLGLVIQPDNPSIARGMYEARSIVCCYIEEPIFSDYATDFSLEENTRSSNIKDVMQKKAKEFYKRVRAEKSFAFSEECVPKEGFLLNKLIPFLTEIVLPNKGFIIIDNKAHWHINGKYHDNYYFETMCEIPYMFTHPPFDTYQDYIYWWYPYHVYPSQHYKRIPPLYSTEDISHFTDGIKGVMQNGGKRKTLRKQRGNRRGRSRHRRNR